MTHLLKPNDNGLASLDEVRAWMEAQATSTCCDEQKDNPVNEDRAKYRTLKFYHEEEHTLHEWESIWQERDVTPITIPELYAIAKYRTESEETEEWFKKVKEAIDHKTIITGTACDKWCTALFHGTMKVKTKVPNDKKEFDIFDTFDVPDKFLMDLFNTNDDVTDIKTNLTALVNGAQVEYDTNTKSVIANSAGNHPYRIYFSDRIVNIDNVHKEEYKYRSIGVKYE